MNGAKWKYKERCYLKKHFHNTNTQDIATHLGRTYSAVAGMATILKLKKSNAFLKSAASGRIAAGKGFNKKDQFKPGHIPANKGQKMSLAVYEKAKATMFKPGNKPHNTKEGNGHIRTSQKIGEKAYLQIKIRDGKWIFLHRFNYEDYWGPIPKGHIIAFKDYNTLNCHPSNLIPITRASNMQRNSIQRFPKELIGLIKLTAKLKKKINEKQD